MTSLENLKEKVESVLEEIPRTRDDDISLTLHIWHKYFPGLLFQHEGKTCVRLESIRLLPREDRVKRLRAIIQNDENKFLPTKWEIAKQRRISEEKWLQYLGYNHQ